MGKDVIMINGIAGHGPVRVDVRQGDQVRHGAPAAKPVGTASAGTTAGNAVGSFATQLASLGAPIDAAKVAAVKQAISEGRYPVDPAKIAERMIALDLPATA